MKFSILLIGFIYIGNDRGELIKIGNILNGVLIARLGAVQFAALFIFLRVFMCYLNVEI